MFRWPRSLAGRPKPGANGLSQIFRSIRHPASSVRVQHHRHANGPFFDDPMTFSIGH